MPDPAPGRTGSSKWLWIVILALLFILVIVWFLDPLGDTEETEPMVQSTELAPAPEGDTVPVELPTTVLAPPTKGAATEAAPATAAP